MIVKGSQRVITFSVIGTAREKRGDVIPASEKVSKNIQQLRVVVGENTVAKSIEGALQSLTLSETRIIDVPALEVIDLANLLDVPASGFLRLQVTLIESHDVPSDVYELEAFLRKTENSIDSLRTSSTYMKGPIEVVQTFDTQRSEKVSEEYDIIRSSIDILQKKQGNIINSTCRRSCLNFQEIKRISVDDEVSFTYYTPLWSMNEAKETFVPKLLQAAASLRCRVVVLFDNDGDWIDNDLRSAGLGTTSSAAGIDADENHRHGSTETTEVGVEVEAELELTMALESETVDRNMKSVLTWLRVAVANNPTADSPSNNNRSHAPSSQPEFLTSRRGILHNDDTCRARDRRELPIDGHELLSRTATNTDGTPETLYQLPSEVLNSASGKESQSQSLYVFDTGSSVYENSYRCALLRFSGWPRDSAPQKKLWDGFWGLYGKCLSEALLCDEVSRDKSLSVMLVDVGAQSEHTTTAETMGAIPRNMWGAGSRAGMFLLVDTVISRAKSLHYLGVLEAVGNCMSVHPSSAAAELLTPSCMSPYSPTLETIRQMEGKVLSSDRLGNTIPRTSDAHTISTASTKILSNAVSAGTMKIRSTDEEPSPSVIDIAAIKAEVLKMETEAEAALIRAVAEEAIKEHDRTLEEGRAKASARLSERLQKKRSEKISTNIHDTNNNAYDDGSSSCCSGGGISSNMRMDGVAPEPIGNLQSFMTNTSLQGSRLQGSTTPTPLLPQLRLPLPPPAPISLRITNSNDEYNSSHTDGMGRKYTTTARKGLPVQLLPPIAPTTSSASSKSPPIPPVELLSLGDKTSISDTLDATGSAGDNVASTMCCVSSCGSPSPSVDGAYIAVNTNTASTPAASTSNAGGAGGSTLLPSKEKQPAEKHNGGTLSVARALWDIIDQTGCKELIPTHAQYKFTYKLLAEYARSLPCPNNS